MEKQFTTPVSMKVTEQQFRNDLETPLKEMGYKFIELDDFEECPYLHNNYQGVIGMVSNTLNTRLDYNRYFIEPYNPKLFLALAGMTNSPDGNVGEWWKYIGKPFEKITNGRMYQQITSGQIFRILNNFNESHIIVDLIDDFIKATKEEIIAFFSETEVEQELIGYRFRSEEFNDMAYTLEYKEYDMFRLDELGYHISCIWSIVSKLKELNLLETFCEPVYAPKLTPISYEEAIDKLNENSKVKYTKVK